MADKTELVSLELPTGELVDVEVPAGWSDQQVTEYATGLGLFDQAPPAVPKDTYTPEPSKGEQFLYGMAKTPGLIEEAANLIEQKLTPKVAERTRDVMTGGDVPMIDETGAVQMDPRYPAQKLGEVVLPAVTEQSIREQQKARKAAAVRADFPGMEGTDTGWVTAGSVTRMLTDMATFPLPFAHQMQLGKFAANGGKLMSAEGRALYGKAMLEGGAGVGAFGATDAAIRSMAETGELSMEDVGQAALISAAGGAVVGPVLAATGGKFMGWLNGKMKTGKPTTPEEVGAVSEAMGKTLTPEEMTQLSDAVNAAGARAKVEAATVDLLNSPKTAMSVTKDGKKTRALTAEEKRIRKEIRGAFAEDADMADFYRREAEGIVAQRQRDAAELERLGPTAFRLKQRLEAQQPIKTQVSKALDEVQLRKIKERQDSALAELELEASKAELPGNTAQVMEAAQARRAAGYEQTGIVGNRESMVNRRGEKRVAFQFGQKLFEKIADLSPRTAMAARKVQTQTNRMSAQTFRQMGRWLADPEITKAFNKSAAFRRAVGNSDEAAMEQIVPGSAAVYREEVKPVLEQMWRTRQVNGLPVLKDVLYPRAVKDVRGLRRKLNRADRDKWDLMVDQWEKKHPKQTMNEEDAAGLLGQVIGGRHLPQDRSRRIKEITEGAEAFYVNPRSALIDAVSRHQEMLATQQFFKNHLGTDVQLGKTLEPEDIKTMLAKAIADKELSGGEAVKLAELLHAWSGPARRGPSAWSRNLHNAITFEALGLNPMATLTQVADQFNNASKFGVRNTLRAMRPGRDGDIMLSAYDAGVRSIAHDIRTQEGFARAVRFGLKALGFDKIDEVFSHQGSKLALRNRVKQARENPTKLYNEMLKWFEPDSARRLVDDLANARTSGDVAALVANDVADVRPQGMLDMPEHYARHPNGRVAYSLLSWTINQMNYVRNRGLNLMEKGIRERNGELVKRGAKALGYIALLNSIGGVSVGTLKDIIRGEELTPERTLAYAAGGALPLAMSGKFVTDKVLAGRGSWTDIMPASSIIDGHAQAVGKFLSSGEITPLLEASGWGRSLVNMLEGVDLISEAEAAYAPGGYDPTQGATPLPAEPVRAENNLPAGWEALPEPTFTPEQLGVQAKPMYTADGDAQLTVPKDTPAKETLDIARKLLHKREGQRSDVYQLRIPDGKGGMKLDKPTAGYGHVLSKAELAKYPVGTDVPKDVQEEWFKKDSTKAWNVARQQAKELGRPDMVPALTSMVFQNGEGWNKIHKETWKKLKAGQWLEAAEEAANSLWAQQTPDRVEDFQRAIRSIIE